MRAAWRARPRCLGKAQCFSVRSPSRNASLTGAISRGIREGQRSAETRRGGAYGNQQQQWGAPVADAEWAGRRPHQQRERGGRVGYLTEAPRTTPYTAADSEFLYGLHSIEAAIRAKRRKLYKLYVYSSEDGGTRSDAEKALYRRAVNARIDIVRVGGPEWKQKLSQLAGGRAHNGFVLEASPIPIPILHSLGSVEYAGASWQAQSSEAATAPPTTTSLVPKAENRFPLFLLLDAVTDTGNIGAILRSAYFFGLDGIIIPEFGSSSTANMLKASSGAAEFMPIFRIRNEVEFLELSQENGWHISTSVAPDAQVRISGSRRPQPVTSRQTPDRILESQPTILIMGNEGVGVRPKLMKVSDSFTSIQDARGVHEGVDSLNVSAAAAILMRDLVNPFLVLEHGNKGRTEQRDKIF